MDKKPKVVEPFFDTLDLKAGIYQWCACGESKGQPFCDPSSCTGEYRVLALFFDYFLRSFSFKLTYEKRKADPFFR